MYRPDNWGEIIEKLCLDEYIQWDEEDGSSKVLAGRLIEAGADAILKALRKEGVRGEIPTYNPDDKFRVFGKVVNGIWAFIPNEEQNGKK